MAFDLLERLADKFVVGDGCWEWTDALFDKGYGRISLRGRNYGAHRVLYELLVGPIPKALELDHLCRVRCCVRPAHLDPVTHAENMRRGHASTAAKERWRARTTCKQGHELTNENTYRYRRNGYVKRSCRECNRVAVRRYQARQRAAS